MMSTANKIDLGTCHTSGCWRAATRLAAPNVAYCDEHAASNDQSTRNYMAQINGHSRPQWEIEKANRLAEIRRHLPTIPDGWGVRIGQQYDRSIISIESPEYAQTAYGDVLFVRPGDEQYETLLPLAQQA